MRPRRAPRSSCRRLTAPELLGFDVAGPAVAMPDLYPAAARVDVFEKHVLLRLESDRRVVVGLLAHLDDRDFHHHRALLVGDFARFDPAESACGVAHFDPAFDGDDDLERITAVDD